MYVKQKMLQLVEAWLHILKILKFYRGVTDNVNQDYGSNHNDHANYPPYHLLRSLTASFGIVGRTDKTSNAPNEHQSRHSKHQKYQRVQNELADIVDEFCNFTHKYLLDTEERIQLQIDRLANNICWRNNGDFAIITKCVYISGTETIH